MWGVVVKRIDTVSMQAERKIGHFYNPGGVVRWPTRTTLPYSILLCAS